MSQNGYVYIFDAGDMVKIGKSIYPYSRMASLKSELRRDILRSFVSPDCSNYSEIEKIMHGVFSNCRVEGEWFDIEFGEAVKALQNQHFKDSQNRLGKHKEIIVSADEDLIDKFSGMAALIGSNASEVMRGLIEQYVKDNSEKMIERLRL